MNYFGYTDKPRYACLWGHDAYGQTITDTEVFAGGRHPLTPANVAELECAGAYLVPDKELPGYFWVYPCALEDIPEGAFD